MKLQIGRKAKTIELPSISGGLYNTNILLGKPYLLSFYRFASCPFCNLRIHTLINNLHKFNNQFELVAIFDSSIENLKEHSKKHNAPFPILADKSNKYYKEYAIQKSVTGMLKGMFFRMPTLLKGMMKGYLPLKIKGSMITMPADFLIDNKGIIHTAYYGKDEGDHLDLEKIIQFSHEKQP